MNFKNFLMLLVVSTAGFAVHAKTELYVPVTWKYQTDGGTKDIYANAKQIRAELKQQQLDAPKFNDYFVFTDSNSSDQIGKQIEPVEKALNAAFTGIADWEDGGTWNGGVPTESNTPGFYTCYKGDATKVAEIISSIADHLYSDQLSLLGWKYKKQMFIEGDGEAEDGNKWLSDDSKLWKNWRGTGDAILLLYATSDDGTDVNEALISKCKN